MTIAACGESASEGQPKGGHSDGGRGGADGRGGAGGIDLGGGGDCPDGQPCESGICAGGACCPSALACGKTCCDSDDLCSFRSCVSPGKICVDAEDCEAGQYCEYALGEETTGQGGGGGICTGGVELAKGRCLPKPPTCGPNEDPGDPPTCLSACQLQPTANAFAPTLKYSWGMDIAPPYSDNVMMTPIVLQLDDDNCDGAINERDIPEIIFSTYRGVSYKGAGVLHAIAVENGVLREKWRVADVVNPTRQIAGGDFHTSPGNEIVACASDGTVKAFDGKGAVLWTSPALTCFMPSIADLDQDGDVEIIVEGAILDGASGAIEHNFSEPLDSSFVISDITGDGKLEVVTGSQAFDGKGQLLVDTNLANTSSFPNTSDWKSSWPAVADLDGDGRAEVVVVHNLEHQLSIWRYAPNEPNDFVVVRPPVDINGKLSPSACATENWGYTHGGGPPTIADFNGDGTPDVALAGGVGYAVFNGKKLMDANLAGADTFLWIKDTSDCSSASTGSTVFDFFGDGTVEVIYSDEERLRVYDGPTGNVLWDTCNTTITLIENPVVADVDNDGRADIVAVSNTNEFATTCDDGTSDRQAGVRVFSDNGWVRTRKIWNQHGYHITNVNEDGTIPRVETANYSAAGLNNFRLNKQPGGEFSAPDAIVSLAPLCHGEYGLVATVQNVGEAALPAGVPVGFYSGTPPSGTLLGRASTSRTLYPLEAENIFLPLPNADEAITKGEIPVYALVDDGAAHPAWQECRSDNNLSTPTSAACALPK